MSSTENYDPYYPDQPVVDQYLPVWARQPAFGPKPAFIWANDDDRRAGGSGTMSYAALTYSELNAAVQRMARGLLEAVRRGDTILLLASPGLRLVELVFACQRAGLVAVPIVPPDPSKLNGHTTPAHRHLLRAVSQTRPAAAVADAGYIGAVMSSPVAALKRLRWVSVGELLVSRRGSGDAAVAGDEPGRRTGTGTGYGGCAPGETYLIQYTSGATGAPRPVVVTAGAAAHNVRAARKAYDLHPGSVIASWLPQYHDCGLMFLLLTVVSGATCVLASPAAFVRRPRLWLELVTEFRATCTPVPLFALPLVLKRGRPEHGTRLIDLGSLRNLILINEPIYKSSVDAFVEEFGRAGLAAASISPSYGLAENCTFVSTAWRGREAKFSSGRLSPLPSYKKLLPTARLPSLASSGEEPEIDIVVVDGQTGEPVEDGVEGEIWVSSPSNASGYLEHPSASREVFRARLPGGRAGGASFVRTGDCGVVCGTERYLYVLGRSSDAIATDGQRRLVYAHYVEAAAFGSSPGSLRGGCIAAFATSPSSVAVVAELQKGRRNAHPRSICDGIRRAVWEEEGVKVGHVVLAESGGVPKTTSGKLRRGFAREMLTGKLIPNVFEVFYDEDSTSGRGGGDDKEMCGTGWVEAGGEVAGMVVMASGSASHRLRLQSSL
jgi:acyl-CoA synthetase (AMP-forming)/AMP-acid ligase II